MNDDIDQPLVGSEILLGCDRAARELNIDVDPILTEHGIDPVLTRQPVGYLRHSQVTQFLQAVETRLGIDSFGFVLGKHQLAMRLGPVGDVVAASPDLRAAIRNSIRFQPLFSEGSTHELIVEEGKAHVSRWSTVAYPFGTRQMRLLGIMMIFRILNTLTPPSWQPSYVSCSFKSISQPHQMSLYFGCPVMFNQDFDGVSFSERDLDLPLETADAALLRLMQRHLEPLLAEKLTSGELLERTESYIRRSLGTGRCTMESCAQLLRVHPRFLQRELARYNTSFKQLLLQARMQLARQYLRDSTLKVSVLADMLGYRGQSALSRAFKQEHKMAPFEWRQQNASRG